MTWNSICGNTLSKLKRKKNCFAVFVGSSLKKGALWILTSKRNTLSGRGNMLAKSAAKVSWCKLMDSNQMKALTGFYQPEHLAAHRDTHAEKDKPCEICGQLFQSFAKLKAHLFYHQEPRFQCEICEKRFYARKQHTVHMKVNQSIFKSN